MENCIHIILPRQIIRFQISETCISTTNCIDIINVERDKQIAFKNDRRRLHFDVNAVLNSTLWIKFSEKKKLKNAE